MKRGLTGHYVPLPSGAGEQARAFVQNPLPPVPPLELDGEIQEPIQHAMLALGRLETRHCPRTTGRSYGRIYAYDKYLKILNEGTEPLK